RWGAGVVLLVCGRASAVLERKRSCPLPAPAAPPGILTVFVASVGVSVAPEIDHGSVPQAASVPFDSSAVLAAPSATRASAGVPLATKMSPRASGVVVPTAAPTSFAIVGFG